MSHTVLVAELRGEVSVLDVDGGRWAQLDDWLHAVADALEAVTAERDAALATIEQAKVEAQELVRQSYPMGVMVRILSTVETSHVAEREARVRREALDEAWLAAHSQRFAAGSHAVNIPGIQASAADTFYAGVTRARNAIARIRDQSTTELPGPAEGSVPATQMTGAGEAPAAVAADPSRDAT